MTVLISAQMISKKAYLASVFRLPISLLLSLTTEFKSNQSAIWDLIQLLEHYPELGEQAMWCSAFCMVSYDMDALFILSIPSFWWFIFFHDSTKVTWKIIKDDDDDHQSHLNIAAKYIHGDCLNKNFDHRINWTKISKWITDESMSNTQQQLLEKLAMSSDFLPDPLISNTITNAVNKTPDSASCCTEFIITERRP